MTKITVKDSKIIYGPYGSWYSEDEDSKLRVVEELDGLFFEIIEKNGKQVDGISLLGSQLIQLRDILSNEIERLRKSGESDI